MDASKDKKEAPKGIIQSKNATFVHQSTSSLNNFRLFYRIILVLSRTVLLDVFIICASPSLVSLHGLTGMFPVSPSRAWVWKNNSSLKYPIDFSSHPFIRLGLSLAKALQTVIRFSRETRRGCAFPKSNEFAMHRFVIALFMHFDNKEAYNRR